MASCASLALATVRSRRSGPVMPALPAAPHLSSRHPHSRHPPSWWWTEAATSILPRCRCEEGRQAQDRFRKDDRVRWASAFSWATSTPTDADHTNDSMTIRLHDVHCISTFQHSVRDASLPQACRSLSRISRLCCLSLSATATPRPPAPILCLAADPPMRCVPSSLAVECRVESVHGRRVPPPRAQEVGVK